MLLYKYKIIIWNGATTGWLVLLYKKYYMKRSKTSWLVLSYKYKIIIWNKATTSWLMLLYKYKIIIWNKATTSWLVLSYKYKMIIWNEATTEYSGYHVPAVRHKETKKSIWLDQYKFISFNSIVKPASYCKAAPGLINELYPINIH